MTTAGTKERMVTASPVTAPSGGHRIARPLAGAVALGLVLLFSGAAHARNAQLFSWWSETRGDNFATTDDAWAGVRGDVTHYGLYSFNRVEARVLHPDATQPTGTVPLYGWYSESRGDNFVTSDPAWAGRVGDTRAPDYRMFRLEGYVYTRQLAGTIPLWSWYSAERADHFITSDPYWDPAGGTSRDGYVFVRTEGYALPPLEDMPVWRVELAVTVCDSSNAESRDHLWVRLNESNRTKLDHPGRDLRRNSVRFYDLTPVTRIDEITKLELSKGGDDGVAICAVQLYVNHLTIFHRSFSPGLSVDNSRGNSRTLTITGAELRRHVYWQAYEPRTFGVPFFMRISADELWSRIVSMVATSVSGKAYWRGGGVVVTQRDGTSVHVALDMFADVPVWWDPEVDVDFDLRFSCRAGRLRAQLENQRVNVDSDWYSEVVSLGFIELADSAIQNGVRRALRRLPLPDLTTPVCPRVSVDSAGGLVLQFP